MMIHFPKIWKSDKVRLVYFVEQDLKLFCVILYTKLKTLVKFVNFKKKLK